MKGFMNRLNFPMKSAGRGRIFMEEGRWRLPPRAVDGDLLDGMYDVAGGGMQGAVKAVLLHEGQPVTEQISWNVMSPNYKILVYGNQVYCRLTGKHLSLWTAYIWEWRWKRCASSTENRTARTGHFLT